LLNLAILGGRVRGGGIPAGILVEIFGPASSGKTVLLCERAGDIQRRGGEIIFNDPEARINKQFAKIFDLDVDLTDYHRPNTVPEVFEGVRNWKPKKGVIHGVFADSLAALSTDMELDDKDSYGMRRANEFSQELRKTCRTLAEENYFMVCSNQIRQNIGAGQFGQKFKSPGGEALAFYSSLRLRTSFEKNARITEKRSYAGKEISRVVGVNIRVEVFKSSIWKPLRTAPVTILFDYGIDDIRQNLQFVKNYTGSTIYSVKGRELNKAMDKSIMIVERDNLENRLKNQVVDLWEDIESKFNSRRKTKKR